jgi:radical SAM superfamily enzyme YgiQ (UPF0313 family)
MSTHTVVFVAFKEFDNLGVGYLASVLSDEGYEAMIIDIRDGKAEILNLLREQKPLIVGFSVIFQYYIHEFAELIVYLRKSGIISHFSAGGQYASMKNEDLFKYIPPLDSVVRFEGEYTFLELVNCVYSGGDWRKIKGLAFKDNGRITVNPLRPPETDLDRFPFPMRSPLKSYALGKKVATILAGRGCVNNCSFCNNTEYLRQSSLPIRRIRKPGKVVEEMEFLYHKKKCSVFLFEDDDFPLKTGKSFDWIDRFCKELKRKKLDDKIMWKINCRPDEVDHNCFALMKNHGLFLVFLGIDDGTDAGLVRLNKHMSIEESIQGVNILKKLEIGFDYGFMLFQPASTFTSVNDNLDFLRQLCKDGTTPVIFLKMMPYFETRVEKDLRKDGRLKGEPGFWDYDFLNISLNHYYDYIMDSLAEWLSDGNGLTNVAKWARNYISVFSHFYRMTPDLRTISAEIKKEVAQSNLFLLDILKELAAVFESGKYDPVKYRDLTGYGENIRKNHDKFKKQIISSVDKVCCIAEYQNILELFEH